MVMKSQSRYHLLFIIPRLPDKIKQHKAGQIALNIDIAPTILAMAGVPAPKTIQGIDLFPLGVSH